MKQVQMLNLAIFRKVFDNLKIFVNLTHEVFPEILSLLMVTCEVMPLPFASCLGADSVGWKCFYKWEHCPLFSLVWVQCFLWHIYKTAVTCKVHCTLWISVCICLIRLVIYGSATIERMHQIPSNDRWSGQAWWATIPLVTPKNLFL